MRPPALVRQLLDTAFRLAAPDVARQAAILRTMVDADRSDMEPFRRAVALEETPGDDELHYFMASAWNQGVRAKRAGRGGAEAWLGLAVKLMGKSPGLSAKWGDRLMGVYGRVVGVQ